MSSLPPSAGPDSAEAAARGGFNLSAWAVRHQALVLFMMLVVAVSGVIAFRQLGRAEDPNFTIKVAIITTVWPGATAIEMQQQVTDRIEKTLQEVPYFERVDTYTKPGFAAMQVILRDNTPPREVPNSFYQIRKKLGDLRVSLPAGVIGPNVNDEYGDVDSILYAITAQGADYAQLKRIADDLKQTLLRVPNVAKANIYGVQDERIYIEFSHARLATLGIAPQAMFDQIQRQNAVTPAGVVESGAQRIPLRVTGALDGAAAVAETPIEAGGRTFRLGDIASVTRGFEDPSDYLVRQRGEPAVLVGVVMQQRANILTLGEALDQTLAEFERNLPVGIEIEKIADQPKVVESAIWEFEKVFLEALGIVMLVSFLSLGWRTGIVVALSVPLVLAATMVAMKLLGIDLHRISLGALIIGLGLLVDDAIIAVEMMVVKMEEGWDRMAAAAHAWNVTAFPMLTGTLVTAAGFIPVGFADSAVAEYTGSLFWVVMISLMISWVVAVIFVPYIGVKLLPDFGKVLAKRAAKRAARGLPPASGHDAVYDTPVYNGLRRVIRWCVDHRITVVMATLVIFAGSVVAFGRVQQQFFPLSDRPELFFQLRLPEGTAIGVTDRTARDAEAMLKDDADIATYTTYVGQGSPRFWLGLNPQLPNEAFAEIVIVARDIAARERIKARIETAVAAGALAEARVRVDRFTFGPPVGFPVQFRVIGPDAMEVRRIAGEVRDIVRRNPGAVDPHLNWNERIPAVTFEIDQERARALGVNPQDVANAMQTLVSGAPVTTVRIGTEQVQVVARAVQSERLDLGRIGDLTIGARNGVPVPLGQVARIAYGHEEAILWRRNRDMSITVRADVVDGLQPPDVTNQIWPTLGELRASLPPGYRLEIGGAIEESQKGNSSINALMPLMLVAMLAILMVQLQSFSRLILVFLTAPLGIIGAALALTLAAKPFGFVALLGLIALAGMIMRNTVILVDQIEADVRDHGHTLRQAIVEATVHRARPVVLTAAAAILAMIPLSGSTFWGPMAFTIMGGLFVATFLTLLFLPALYALWFRRRIKADAAEARAAEPEPTEVQLPLPMPPPRLAAE